MQPSSFKSWVRELGDLSGKRTGLGVPKVVCYASSVTQSENHEG